MKKEFNDLIKLQALAKMPPSYKGKALPMTEEQRFDNIIYVRFGKKTLKPDERKTS